MVGADYNAAARDVARKVLADASVPVFEGADEQHSVDGLTLRDVVVRGQRLVDAETAERIAGVTIGEHVRNVRFE